MSRMSFKPVTKEICKETGEVFGKQISVIDTPGILCAGSEEKIKTYCHNILQTTTRCLFLVVIKIDRFTEEEH